LVDSQLSASETPFPFSITPSHICSNPDSDCAGSSPERAETAGQWPSWTGGAEVQPVTAITALDPASCPHARWGYERRVTCSIGGVCGPCRPRFSSRSRNSFLTSEAIRRLPSDGKRRRAATCAARDSKNCGAGCSPSQRIKSPRRRDLRRLEPRNVAHHSRSRPADRGAPCRAQIFASESTLGLPSGSAALSSGSCKRPTGTPRVWTKASPVR
jgi:hypothetical protein